MYNRVNDLREVFADFSGGVVNRVWLVHAVDEQDFVQNFREFLTEFFSGCEIFTQSFLTHRGHISKMGVKDLVVISTSHMPVLADLAQRNVKIMGFYHDSRGDVWFYDLGINLRRKMVLGGAG